MKEAIIKMQMQEKIFDLLTNKDIIKILDGDTSFGSLGFNDSENNENNIEISMPYLTGPSICDVANLFGLNLVYDSRSRWSYFYDLLSYCNENNKISDLLSYLFSKGRFAEKLKGFSPEIIENSYTTIIKIILEEINKILYFSNNELVKIGDIFSIRPIGSNVTVSTPNIKVIDREYVKDISNRAIQDIEAGNYDSALTKSRTLLEEVFCYVIECKDENPCKNGDIGKLYNQVKQLYNMHQHKDLDKRIKMLLSGLEKILTAITEMRNIDSDAHGVGNRRINIKEHHARLFVNSATTMADFILAVEKVNK